MTCFSCPSLDVPSLHVCLQVKDSKEEFKKALHNVQAPVGDHVAQQLPRWIEGQNGDIEFSNVSISMQSYDTQLV